VEGGGALRREYSVEMAGYRPLPDPDPVTEPFWVGVREHRLLVQTCATCGLRRHPPRVMCPRCQSLELRWDAVSGRGHVWSFVVCHAPLLPYFTARSPWPVSVIELEEGEGLRMVGQVMVADVEPLAVAAPDRLRIGASVRVTFEHLDEIVLPQWRLVG